MFSKIQQEDVLESRFSVQVFLRMSFVLLQIELWNVSESQRNNNFTMIASTCCSLSTQTSLNTEISPDSDSLVLYIC